MDKLLVIAYKLSFVDKINIENNGIFQTCKKNERYLNMKNI
jgi:hypothetical protein